MRRSVFLVLLPFIHFLLTSQAVMAQLPAAVSIMSHATGDGSRISVSWTAEDEHKWHTSNDERLEAIGITLNLSSSKLITSKDQHSFFSFDLKASSVEVLLNIENLQTTERIGLWDHLLGKMIWVADQKPGRQLTPVFNPKHISLVWQSDDKKGYTSEFTLERIFCHSADLSRTPNDIGFNTALPCHPNSTCKTDSILALISRSTVRMRMVMEEGIGWCSGSFINTTRNDKTPYLLSAYHCQFEYTPIYDMWRFDLHYVSPTCDNPPAEPKSYSITGCELISLGQASDFLLVKLLDPVPISQQVTFAGWYRDDTSVPDTGYLVHHPNADIRKFSTCTSLMTIHPNQIGWTEGYTTPPHHHFRFKFTDGGHEPGSSGGPYFNQDGLIVGQLHGGNAGCQDDNTTYVGRLAKSWELGIAPQERLRDWLDPDNTGVQSVASIENIGENDKLDIIGVVRDPAGRPVKNAILSLSGSKEDTLMTGSEGTFRFSALNRSGEYNVTPRKNTLPTNGLSAIDLVAIQKHLLGKDSLDLTWQLIAADATNNGALSAGDILLLLRLMLGKIQVLPSSDAWRFDPPLFVMDQPAPGGPIEIQFTAIKIGDMNTSADPQK